MKNLTTHDLIHILRIAMGDEGKWRGIYISLLDDEQVTQAFGELLKSCFQHATSKHYTSMMDEPRY